MLKKVKDYVTWGEINSDALNKLLESRAKLLGDKPVTDSYVKTNSKFKSISGFSTEILDGKAKLTDLKVLRFEVRISFKGLFFLFCLFY